MAIKISDIRNNHDILSEDERAAAYQQAVTDKVAELKARYAGNSKYANFTEDDWKSYAEVCLKTEHAINSKSYYYGLPGVENDPELAMWTQYTYEEILQMEAGGVSIPEEILSWAHSMQDNDVTSYEVDENSSEEVVEEQEGSELSKLEKEAKKMGEKSKKANEEANLKYAEFQDISKKAEEVQREQAAAQKDGLQEIQELTAEYADFADRIKKGEQLSDGEKKRYQELNSLLNGKDGELVTDLQASTAELDELISSMDNLEKGVEKNIELGDDTIDKATELAAYEKEHKTTNVEGNFFINMATGQTLDELYGAKGQSIARDVFDSGNSLIQFSNTLSNTLMSSQYSALYEFATQFTEAADETLDGTKEAMGENFNKSTEELNGDEANVETPANEEAEEQLTMKDLTTLGFGTKQLIEKDIEVREASQKVAEQAEQEVEAHRTEQEKLQKEKEAVQDEQESVANDIAGSSSTPEVEEEPNVEEPGDLEDAQETQEDQKAENEDKVDKQTENENKAAEVVDINAAIEASNIEGDTAKERLEKATEVNDKYDTFNDEASDIFDKTSNVGTAATVFGTGMIVNGATLIATGVPLLSNPFTHLIGAALIVQGTLLTTAGTGFFGIGGYLMAIGLKGADESMFTGDQIDLTDEIIQDAMAQIEELEGGEAAPGRSAAEQERFDMRKAGASLPEQARHFRERSAEETLKSAVGIVGTKFVEAKSEQEAKKSEGIAEGIEKRLSGKKEEYDVLKEKKEKFEEQQEKLANASSPEDYKNLNFDPAEQFTSFDQQKMTMLGNQLQMFGDIAQAELFKSLEEVDGLREFLADKEEDALRTIDYGQVAQIVGMQLFDQSKNNILLITRMLLGLTTVAAGKGAETVGGALDKVVDKADAVNDDNINKIMKSQQTVENVTMSKALELQSPEESAEGETAEDTEETQEEKEEQQPLTKGQATLKKMQANGASLSEQTMAFSAMSTKEGAEAEGETMATYMIQAESNREAKTAEFVGKVVEKTMKEKREEYDELTEKQKKAEEAKKQAKDRAEAAASRGVEAKPTEVQNPEEEFTAEDEQRLNKLGGQLERVGDSAQGRLLKALEKVEGLDEFLADFSEDAIEAMDFGAISEILGMILYEQSAGNIFLIHQMLLGMIAMRAGKEAQEAGTHLGESIGKVSAQNASNTAKIYQAQAKVEEITMSEALGGSTESAEENTEGAESTEGSEETGTETGGAASTDPTEQPGVVPTSAPAVTTSTSNSSEVVTDGVEIDADPVTDEPVLTFPAANPNSGETEVPSDDKPKLVGAAAIAASMDSKKFVKQAQQNAFDDTPTDGTESTSTTVSTKKEEDPAKEGAAIASKQGETNKQINEGTKSVASANKEVASASKESKSEAKESKKDEKQLEAESKNLTKLIEQDTKKIEKLSAESKAAIEEQMLLAAEYEQLSTAVEEANAKVEASQSNQQTPTPQPMASPASGEEGEGGLLSPAPQSQPQMQDTSIQQEVVTINANQSRMAAIGARFTTLDQKVNKNRVQITKYSASINKRYRKFNKISKEKLKIQKAAQKAELKKQKRMQKLNAAIEVVNTTFSIVTSVGTIMEIVGTKMTTAGTAMISSGIPMLSNPFTVAAGIALITGGSILTANGGTLTGVGVGFQTAGIIGVAACGLTKAGIALANGDIKGALMQLASTVISVAMAFVPGVGGAASAGMSAAQAGLQIASASLNIVSSTANMAASAQTLAGKEQSAWLGTVSQIAGVAGSLTNVGAGLAGGIGKGLGAAVKVVGAVGSVASATATISTLIKQANGDDPGKFEEIMGLIGTGLSTVASLMSLGMMASGGSSSDDSNTENGDKSGTEVSSDTPQADNLNTENETPNISDPKTQKMLAKAENMIAKQGVSPEVEASVMNEINKLPPEQQKLAMQEINKLKAGQKSEVQNDTPELKNGEKVDTSGDGQIVDTTNTGDGQLTGAAAEVEAVEQNQQRVEDEIDTLDSADAQLEQNSEVIDEIENNNNDNSDNEISETDIGSDTELEQDREINTDTDVDEIKTETESDIDVDDVESATDTEEVQTETPADEVTEETPIVEEDTDKEPKLTKKEQKALAEKEFIEKVKTENGLTPGEEQVINGKEFVVTEDGKFMVNGEEVSPGEMHAQMKAANAGAAADKKSFDDLEVGGVKEIDGNIFEKQEDGSFKLVKGYDDDMNRQLSDQAFAQEDLYNMSQGTDEQRAQWQTENIDPIKNSAPTEPKAPVVPEEPVASETPETPEVPETPETPETPDTPEASITPEQKQQQQASQIAEQNGMKPGKSELIDGHTFEVTKDGQCLIDGQQVNPGEMKDRLSIAKTNSDRMQQQLADCKDGESVFINGQEFVKQAGKEGEEPTFKLVSGYDENLKQQTTNKVYSDDKVHDVGMMTDADSEAWADTQIRNEKVQTGFEKTSEVLGKIAEVGSGASQMAGTIDSMLNAEEELQRNVLHLSNMKKGKALMRKIKRKRHAQGYNPYK